ncbi:MAG: ParB/RepB/Spo0J family partition protein, partial [Clostridia bacterium]|nr:ParB/RepB/Spo0J family partition protein [Clostridia bacterium]
MANTKKPSGLGKSFYEVFYDNNLTDSQKGVAEMIRISAIDPRHDQPRKTFERESLESLADSIAAHGVLQPIIVRENPAIEGTYEIIAGERRWRAAKMAGLTEIPAVIFDG